MRPSDVGIEDDGRRRRVAGLRREEVARLAGISAEYYLRIEQGREVHPSETVLSALARALVLGPSGEEFLQRLVRPVPERSHDSRRMPSAEERLAQFIQQAPQPAFAHDRVLEVIVANDFARALSPAFSPGVNLMRAVLLDDELASLYRNRDDAMTRLASYLRAQAAIPPHDPRLAELVDELSEASPRFASLWARGDLGAPSSGLNSLRHPLVGELEVRYERLCFAGTDYPVIVMYHAEPGSASERALRRIGESALGADV
jgi:transcriptional regulator with XRE-family HTH domain